MRFNDRLPLQVLLAFACLPALAPAAAQDEDAGRRWLAGDHHVHSEWSVDWDHSTSPPTPIRGGDSPYSRSRNARQAEANGLAWMVHTDHGGPGHSRVTRDQAWPALEQARRDVPGLVQFHGMEFDVPGAEHASVVMVPGPREREELFVIERDYSRNEPLDGDTRDDGTLMLQALAHMRALPAPPLVFVNHPARTATAVAAWGEVEPEELLAWHDAAPHVLVGMEGAPGHQASPLHRGLYRNALAPTFGGFDQMVAHTGGVWDRMLVQGRRFWITATSDSHVNARDGGEDFDPGQYSKTYVWASDNAGDILDGLRAGRMFAVTGDLVDALELRVHAAGEPARSASPGGTLVLPAAATMRIELRLRQPARPNANGQRPPLRHVEMIVGATDEAGRPYWQTRRFDPATWRADNGWLAMAWELPVPPRGGYVRVRGSSSPGPVPQADVPGEDPWQDLWFYSNPVFVETLR